MSSDMQAVLAVLSLLGAGVAWFFVYIRPFLSKMMIYTERMVCAIEAAQKQIEHLTAQMEVDKNRREQRFAAQMDKFRVIEESVVRIETTLNEIHKRTIRVPRKEKEVGA